MLVVGGGSGILVRGYRLEVVSHHCWLQTCVVDQTGVARRGGRHLQISLGCIAVVDLIQVLRVLRRVIHIHWVLLMRLRLILGCILVVVTLALHRLTQWIGEHTVDLVELVRLSTT